MICAGVKETDYESHILIQGKNELLVIEIEKKQELWDIGDDKRPEAQPEECST